MSKEASGTTSRVITIVQTPLPISSATALDVDTSHSVQLGDLTLDSLGQQDKNPFSSFSEEHLSRLDDFLSTEEAQKILQQTNVESYTQVAGQKSTFTESDTDVPDERSEDLLDIFSNKSEDQHDLSSPFSDHAYAIPLKRTSRASSTVTSPQSQMSSPKKQGQAKDEVMIVSDVGNDVVISQEETKTGKGRGRGRKSQGEVPLGSSNNRRSSRISDNEQREMAEKIRQENLQKEKEAMEAMKSDEEEESAKKRPRGRPKKNEDEEDEDEGKQDGKGGLPKSGAKEEEDSGSESEEDDKSQEANTGKRGRPRKEKPVEKDEGSEDESETKKSVKGKRGGKGKANKSDLEDEGSLKGKGKKGRSKSRTKKGEDADDESEEETPKKGRPKKGKKNKGKTVEGTDDESETESPTKEHGKRGRPKKGKSKQKESESESETESPTKGQSKRGRPKKGKAKEEESESESESETESPSKGKGKKGRPKKSKGKNEKSEDESEEESPKKGKAPKGKGKTKKWKQSEEESGSTLQTKKGKKGKTKKQDGGSESESKLKKGKVKKVAEDSEEDSPKKTGKKGKLKKKTDDESEDETLSKAVKGIKGKIGKKQKDSNPDTEAETKQKNKAGKDKKIKGNNETDEGTDGENKKQKNKNAKTNGELEKGKKGKVTAGKQKESSDEDEPLSSIQTESKVQVKQGSDKKHSFSNKNIFEALISSPLKRKTSTSDKDAADAKKIKSDKGKSKHESGDGKQQDSQEAKKTEDSTEAKTPKSVKKKYRKSEDFLDLTMTDLFKPDGVIPNDEQEHLKAGVEKHRHDSDSNIQGVDQVLNKDSNEKKLEENNELDKLKKGKDVIGQSDFEIKKEESDEQKEVVNCDLEKQTKVDNFESDQMNNEVTQLEKKSFEDSESNNKGSLIDIKVVLPTGNVKKDENSKIKEMYKSSTEKVDHLNSSTDSNFEIVSVMVTSDTDESEPIQFEATIENVEFVSLPISGNTGQNDMGKFETEISNKSIFEKLSAEQTIADHSEFTATVQNISQNTGDVMILPKTEELKNEKQTSQSNEQKKEIQVKTGSAKKGRKIANYKSSSDLDTSDITGSELEEDSRVLRRKRARNPLVEEFLKKETRKQRKKTVKSEEEEVTDKEPEKQVKEEKKVTKVEEKVEEEEEEEEEETDDDSEEEYEPPDQKYCICKKPYGNKFMICCDRCENWYHGKCVGITRARGKEMDENKEEYICDICKENNQIDKFKNKSSPSGNKHGEVSKPLIVKMPGLSPKSNKESQEKKTVGVKTKEKKDRKEGNKPSKSSPSFLSEKKLIETTPGKKVTIQKSSETVVKKSQVDNQDKLEKATAAKIEKDASNSEKTEKVIGTPSKTEKPAAKLIKMKKTDVAITGKTDKVATGKTEKAAATPGKTEKVVATPGKTEKVVATPGKTEKVSSTAGKIEKVATVGKSEKAGATPGKTEKVVTMAGKTEKVASTPDKSDKIVAISGKSTPDKSDKIVAISGKSTPDKSDKILAISGKSEVGAKKVSSANDTSEKTGSTPGKTDKDSKKTGKIEKTPVKVSSTSGKSENTLEIFSPDKAKVIAPARKISTENKKSEVKLPRCIGPKCGKLSRSDSVYCSNECIINHSQDSLNIIHSQLDSVVKRPSKLTGDKRIVVIEKTTGKILTGEKAPTEAELCSWLEKNPSFSVLCPTMKKIKSLSKEQQQKESHHTHHSHHEHQHHTHHGNKERKDSSDHNKDKKDGSSQHRHRKDSSSKDRKSDSSKDRKRSHSDSSKDRKAVQKKHDDKHSGHKQSSTAKKEEKTDKLGDKTEDTGPDPVRLNVRKSLRDALASRAEKADDVMLSLSEIKSLALDIENELYNFFKETGHKYKAKYRSLIFNIKDSKNKGLFRKILNGELKPNRLIKMTPEELASRELAKWREFETKHELDMIVQAEEEMMKEGVHFVKKTHKGEIELDADGETVREDEDLSTLEDHGVEKPKSKLKTMDKKDMAAVDFIGGLIGDTTAQHKKHLFDLNCRICTGKELPKAIDTTPKKVRVARKVKIEEPSSSDKKEKTEVEQKKAEDVVKEVLKAIQKAKKEQMEEAKRMEEQKTSEVKPESSGVVADSTVTVRSPDSALQSGLEQKPDFTPKGPQVWKGFISMQDVAKFVTTAYRISGPSDKLNIPDTVHVCGRISPEQVFDYLAKMRKVGTKDIIVLRFIPGPNEEKTSYINLYSYLNSRSRCGVVGSVSKYIKDFYILPLASHSKIPSVIKPFIEQGLERNRPHMLLAVIVRQKLKAHGVEPDGKQKRDQVQKVRSQEKRPYTPPGQKSYGPPSKLAKIEKKGIDLKKSHAKKHATSTTVTTSSSVTMATPPTTRGHSDAGDPIVEVYGSDSAVEEPEPYDPEKPTVDSKPYDPNDTTVFKKPGPIKRPSPSSSPSTSSIKPLRGAATLVSQMLDKLKSTNNATEANEAISEGLSPMATVTDKQKLLLELTQRVCEQKKLIELKHAGKSVQEATLPLVAVANAMTAISQISKTLISAPKRAAISASQQSAKPSENTTGSVSSDTTATGTEITKVVTSTTVEMASAVSVAASSKTFSSNELSNTTVSVSMTPEQNAVDKTPGLLPHEVAAQSDKMSTMPEALKSLFSSIPGSYSHVTNYVEADLVKTNETSEQGQVSKPAEAEAEAEDDKTQDESTKSVTEKFLKAVKPSVDKTEKSVVLEPRPTAENNEEGKDKFNVSLLAFDYGDSDSENDEVAAAASVEADENNTRPSSVMSSSSDESQDSSNIPPLQYPPLPSEPDVPPPLPDEPPPPPPDHDPEEEEKSEGEEESGKKGKKKKKKKKKGKKDKPAPEIMLEAKDPISKAILDASFRRLMENQSESMMSPVVGPNVSSVPISGPVTGPPFQSPAVPNIMGPIPSSKPALLPTPGLQSQAGMMSTATSMGMPQSVSSMVHQPQALPPLVQQPQAVPPLVQQPQAVPPLIQQPQPLVKKPIPSLFDVGKPIPSLFDVEVTPSRNLNLKKLEGEPENELDRELRDLADADWRAEEPVPQDLDLRQDQDLRIMDVDMRLPMNKPMAAPRTVWPEDIDHRKGGRFTPDPLFGSDLQLPCEDSDLRNFCSPLDQDYRRRDMPPKDIAKDNFINVTEDQDFRISQNKHGHRRGSHERDRGSDNRRRRHDDSSHRKSKRRRRNEDRDFRHRDRDHRRGDKFQDRRDNRDQVRRENTDQDHRGNGSQEKTDETSEVPQDVDHRPKVEKKIPPPPRLADKVPIPPPQVLAQKAAEGKPVATPKLPPLQPPPLPPGIDVVPFTPTPTQPPRRSQPPPPGIDDW